MKRLNKIFIFFIILFVINLIGIPNIPYKLPSEMKNSDYIEFDISISQTTGGPLVISGREQIDEYSKEKGYTEIKNDEIYLSGNTPTRVITTFRKGIPTYRYFKIYGDFEIGPDQYNVLTFDVKEWFPLKKYVAIKDTTIWNKYITIYIFIITINMIILIILGVKTKKRE